MSLQNGFATRQHEKRHYSLIRYLVLVLEKRLLRFYQGQACNQQKFASILHKLSSRIGKLQDKYSQPKFADSLADLLAEIKTLQTNRLSKADSYQFQSMIGNDENKSQISLDFSLDRLPKATKLYSVPLQDLSAYKSHRNKYRSFESIKTTPVISERQQEQFKFINHSSRSKVKDFSHLKLRLQPPKLDSYINKIRKQTKELMSKRKWKQQARGQIGGVYLGQRRKKNKKTMRTYQIQ